MGLLLLTYVLGVLTVPALVATALLAFWLTAPDSDLPSEHAAMPEATAGRASSQLASPYSGRRTGWLHITRSLGTPPAEAFDGQSKLADMVTRGIAKWIHGKRDTKRTDGAASSTADGAQDFYFVVLEGDTLVMYDGEAMNECRGVIIMSKHRVALHHRKNVTESQVYSRRTPIRLSPVTGVETQLCKGQVAEYYIYADRPTDKEDWYFALLWSSLEYGLPDSSDDDQHDSHSNGDSHISGTPSGSPNPGEGDSSPAEHTKPRLTAEQREQLRLRMRRSCMEPDHAGLDAVLQTISKRGASATAGAVREDEWLNAILGRTFIGAYKTEWVRQHFIRKMQTKFDRVQRPMFLERVVVADLDVGDNVPVITSPKLESFSADGQVDMSMYMHYMGGFRLVLNTAVKLGALRLSISLSVVLQALAGKMLLRFKPAPSNRFWLAFYEMPRISLKVSPVFMQKQVKYAMVSQAIEKQIYDMVRLSLVLPNMDDTVFFPTLLEDGGILERSLKEYKDRGLDAVDDAEEDSQSVNSESADSTKNSMAASERTSSTPQRLSDNTSTFGSPEPSISERSVAASGGISGNSAAAHHESRSASRFAMTTPTSISDGSPGSSHESLARLTPAKQPSSSNMSTMSQPVPPTARSSTAKSSLSISAASLFKRAKYSQAAESAKSWWQNIQQTGLAGSDGGQSTQSAVNGQDEQSDSSIYRHSLPAMPSDAEREPHSRSQSLSPPLDSHISTPPKAATGEPVHSQSLQFPQLDGASSSVYSKRSSMVSDSLLVRRRPAAANQGEVDLTRRRNSRAANTPHDAI
ncbi:hypothetical protein IWW52_002946 [Coemansia sp. RSA 2704]|nr:hypothetical protein IWW52_002946 [Coemansia sp. RSA 2704]